MSGSSVARDRGRVGRKVERGAHGLSALLAAFAALALLGLLVLSTADVLSRQLRGQGVGGAVEYGEVLLVLLTLLSLAAAYRHGAHVSADFATRRLPPRAAAVAQAVGLVVVIAVLAVLVRESTAVAVESVRSGEYRMGIVRAPLWPARLAVPLGFGAVLIEMAVVLVSHVRVALGVAPAPVLAAGVIDDGRDVI